MPEFVSRWWGWFRVRPRTQQVLIGVVVLALLVLASTAVAMVSWLFFFVALAILAIRLIRRRPVRPWAIAAGGALVFAVVFTGLSSTIYPPTVEDQARIDKALDKAEKPRPEKQQPKPPTNKEQASKPEPKPELKQEPKQEQEPKPEQEQSLYGQAVLEPLAPYEIDYTSDETAQRLDVYIVTERTTNKPRLGRILIDLQENSEHNPDLVTAFFCTKPGEQSCTDTLFATGEYAATAQGKSFMTGEKVLSEVGEWPFIKVEF